jgi:hypothetical protein
MDRERTRFRFPEAVESSLHHHSQIGSRAHLFDYLVSKVGSFIGDELDSAEQLSTQFHLVTRRKFCENTYILN